MFALKKAHLLCPAMELSTQEGSLQSAPIWLYFDALSGHFSFHPVTIVHLATGGPLESTPSVHQSYT